MPITNNTTSSNVSTTAQNLRSTEIQDFISNKPSFIIRWGISIFFCILVLLGIVCWFIQYPDIVFAKARLSSINAPKEIITKSDGKLKKIAVVDNDSVSQGDIVGYMECIAAPNAVLELFSHLDTINNLIENNKTDEILKYFPNAANAKYNNSLGELQSSYQSFIQSFISFKDFLNFGFYNRKKSMLLVDLSNTLKLHSILQTQKGLLQQDVSLSEQTFEANKTLADEKVISPLDYRNEKSKLIGKKLSLPQINAALVTNESQQNDKRKEIADLENQITVQKNTFIQALHTLQSQVQTWETKYLLKAPITGKIYTTGFYQENQEIKVGQILFYVVPNNSNYFVEMMIPQYNFGKVKSGQSVLLKFIAYPNEEFGAVEGTITHINTLPTDSGYLAKVSLPKGLKTNYQKHLQYKFGLFAQAEIITDNMRLLQRFYNNLTKQLKR
jgi:multidrug resistance efflux pump